MASKVGVCRAGPFGDRCDRYTRVTCGLVCGRPQRAKSFLFSSPTITTMNSETGVHRHKSKPRARSHPYSVAGSSSSGWTSSRSGQASDPVKNDQVSEDICCSAKDEVDSLLCVSGMGLDRLLEYFEASFSNHTRCGQERRSA